MVIRSSKIILILLLFFSNACSKKENKEMEVTVEPETDYYSNGIESASKGDFKLAKKQFEATLKINPSHLSAKGKLKIIFDVFDVFENKIQESKAILVFTGMNYPGASPEVSVLEQA
jgi:outer membrane protein assembly factor BamD (BamD/ComL family)